MLPRSPLREILAGLAAIVEFDYRVRGADFFIPLKNKPLGMRIRRFILESLYACREKPPNNRRDRERGNNGRRLFDFIL